MTNNTEAIESIIESLFQITKDNELLGAGSLPPLEMRVSAAKSLGTYVPYPKAVEALIYPTKQGWAPKVRLTWVPFEATDAEVACFAGVMGNMGKGWESGYAIMDELFAELQAGNK